jgi:hypothetical protein
MTRIVHEKHPLRQYLEQLSSNPDIYRPACCPHCGKSRLWHHGHYTRQADREHCSRESLNPVPVLRFHLPALRQDLFISARLHCSKALVFVANTACRSGAGFEWAFLLPNQQNTFTDPAYHKPVGAMAER